MAVDGSAILRRVNGERVVVLGWSRAILMQLAHPLVGAGVAEHSAFRGSVTEAALRLHNTVAAMLSLTFGDPSRRRTAIDRIRAIHRTVNGTLPEAAGRFPAGTPYSAEDPALLLWVHATLLESDVDIYERVVAPLGREERDALCAASVPFLLELGGDSTSAPASWEALRGYMAAVESSNTLAVTTAAREVGKAVVSPRAAGLSVPLAGAFHELIAVGLLPPFLREAYGFPWSKTRDARFRRALQAVRLARRLTPDALARFREGR
jgi:uncharacterized protein (DUF2236 family)